MWSIDGFNNYATMHIVTRKNSVSIKNKIREDLMEHGISHVTIELEKETEKCENKSCSVCSSHSNKHHHHTH